MTNPSKTSIKALKTLQGRQELLHRGIWSPDGRRFAAPQADGAILVWDIDAERNTPTSVLESDSSAALCLAWQDSNTIVSGSKDSRISIWSLNRQPVHQLANRLEAHRGAVLDVAICQPSRLISSSADHSLIVWDLDESGSFRRFRGHFGPVYSLALSPDGSRVASGSADQTIRIWQLDDGRQLHCLEGHTGSIFSLAWGSAGLAAASADETISVWEADLGRRTQVLEGHTSWVIGLDFDASGEILASKAHDESVRFWRTQQWDLVDKVEESIGVVDTPYHGISFHPERPWLASLDDEYQNVRVWQLDIERLRSQPSRSVSYRNAKVILVGNTGVGKTGLAGMLQRNKYEPSEDSTHGRVVTLLEEEEVVDSESGYKEKRETYLWDMAGQPGYRLVHQLHLEQVTVAIVVFDARSETDPFAGVWHWDRALRQASQRRKNGMPAIRKILVAARADRGHIAVSQNRIDAFVRDRGFDAYIETSSKTGLGIEDLRETVRETIQWVRLPKVSSVEIFNSLHSLLKRRELSEQILIETDQIFREYCRWKERSENDKNLKEQIETSLRLLETWNLVRRLSFDHLVLMHPELLDAFASAIINEARREPQGFGSVHEEVIIRGQFRLPQEVRKRTGAAAHSLRHATIVELQKHDLAVRFESEAGSRLVFPSQINREMPQAPEPQGIATVFVFEGAVQNIYCTLAVSLQYGGLSSKEPAFYRNATEYELRAGGRFGIHLREVEDGRGELSLYFSAGTPPYKRIELEDYVQRHLSTTGIEGSVELRRKVACLQCGTTVPDSYVEGLKGRGESQMQCYACGSMVPLEDPFESLRRWNPDMAVEMERTAEDRRKHAVFVASAQAGLRPEKFQDWAGGAQATLAITFTDIVGSTPLNTSMGDQAWEQVRKAHFSRVRQALEQHRGREVKNQGDGFLTVFRTSAEALDFAMDLHADTGSNLVAIRAGIHVGPISVDEGDVFGSTVNLASRITSMASGAEIWVSERAWEDVQQQGEERHRSLNWRAHPPQEIKGLTNRYGLYQLEVTAKDAPPSEAPAGEKIRFKKEAGIYDVFLCHNSVDKPAIRQIAQALLDRGIRPWFDQWEIVAGQVWQDLLNHQIESIPCAAVFIGSGGKGPWHDLEIKSFINRFAKRKNPIIPIILADLEGEPDWSPILDHFQRVDFRESSSNPLEKLIEGIEYALNTSPDIHGRDQK